MRNLALRSAEAAKDTSTMIESSQLKAGQGVDAAGEVDRLLVEVRETIARLNAVIGEVANASGEQTRGIDQVNAAMSQMDTITQSNAANAEETAAASEELSAQARMLLEMVDTLSRHRGGKGRKQRRCAGSPAGGRGGGRDRGTAPGPRGGAAGKGHRFPEGPDRLGHLTLAQRTAAGLPGPARAGFPGDALIPPQCRRAG